MLDLSNNRISRLEGLAHLEELEEVWANNNALASFDEIEAQLADKDRLQTVYFEGNPLQKNNPVLYRNKVRLALPRIKQIDASESFFSFSHSSTGEVFAIEVLSLLRFLPRGVSSVGGVSILCECLHMRPSPSVFFDYPKDIERLHEDK